MSSLQCVKATRNNSTSGSANKSTVAIRRRAHAVGCRKGPGYTNYSPFATRKSRTPIGGEIQNLTVVEPLNHGSGIPLVPVTPVSHGHNSRPESSSPRMRHGADEPEICPTEPLSWPRRLRKNYNKPHFPNWASFGTSVRLHVRTILLYNYAATFLLPFIPAGFAVNYTSSSATVIFCVNFVAIFPSATILSAALNDLTIRLGQRLGALLNQTFGYALFSFTVSPPDLFAATSSS